MASPRSDQGTVGPATAAPSPARAVVTTTLELFFLALLVVNFHLPYLNPGLPGGDYASDMMVAAVDERLVPSPLDLPAWDPIEHCGRPTIAYFTPLRLASLPFHRVPDPV